MAGEEGGDVRALVEQMAKALVDEPDKVSVTAMEGDSSVLELRVAPGDLGKVIGKQGRTVRAMRTILSAAGMKLNKRFSLEIIEYRGVQAFRLSSLRLRECSSPKDGTAKLPPNCTPIFLSVLRSASAYMRWLPMA